MAQNGTCISRWVKTLNLPRMVMEGLSLPSALNRDSLVTLASGSLGLGSQGYPSTRDHAPNTQSQPITL